MNKSEKPYTKKIKNNTRTQQCINIAKLYEKVYFKSIKGNI